MKKIIYVILFMCFFSVDVRAANNYRDELIIYYVADWILKDLHCYVIDKRINAADVEKYEDKLFSESFKNDIVMEVKNFIIKNKIKNIEILRFYKESYRELLDKFKNKLENSIESFEFKK